MSSFEHVRSAFFSLRDDDEKAAMLGHALAWYAGFSEREGASIEEQRDWTLGETAHDLVSTHPAHLDPLPYALHRLAASV